MSAPSRLFDEEADLIATVAYQLRQPTTVLAGGASLLRQLWESGVTEDGLALIDAMVRQGRRLNRLIDDLILTAELDLRTLPIELKVVPVADVLEGLARSMGGDERVLVSCEDSVRAFADPFHLEHVMANLIENGVLHGSPPVVVLATEADDGVHIDVTDHGTGVGLEDIPHLFERFTPLARHKVGRSGLGLAIARDLARSMRGDVVYRVGGYGTRFEVIVPKAIARVEPWPDRSVVSS